MGSEVVPNSNSASKDSEANKVVVKLELNPILPLITKTKLVLVLGNRYRVVILRGSRTRGVYYGVVDLGGNYFPLEDFTNETELANMLRGCQDVTIKSNADIIAEKIFAHIKRWKALLALKELGKVDVQTFNSRTVKQTSTYAMRTTEIGHCEA